MIQGRQYSSSEGAKTAVVPMQQENQDMESETHAPSVQQLSLIKSPVKHISGHHKAEDHLSSVTASTADLCRGAEESGPGQ